MSFLGNLFGFSDNGNSEPKSSEPEPLFADVADGFNEIEEQIEKDGTGMPLQNEHNYALFNQQQKILDELDAEGYKLDTDHTGKWYAR